MVVGNAFSFAISCSSLSYPEISTDITATALWFLSFLAFIAIRGSFSPEITLVISAKTSPRASETICMVARKAALPSAVAVHSVSMSLCFSSP